MDGLGLTPVPETERVEEFSPSIPTLRVQAIVSTPTTRDASPSLRRITDPLPSSPLSPAGSTPSLPYRARNTSPYSRGHLRSKSSTTSLAPQMARAQSMPGVYTSGQLFTSPPQRPVSPSSPRGSPSSRFRVPRKSADEVFPGLGLSTRTLQGISEAEPVIYEEERTPKPSLERSVSPVPGPLHSSSFPRIRRPASPLRYMSQPGSSSNTAPTTPTSLGSSPSMSSISRFGDYGNGYTGYFTSSSVPSTPTSARSRSPSISSLETIPDSPGAEEAATEADRIAQLKAAVEAAEGDETRSKANNDNPVNRGRGMGGFGRDKRKRWSVCGAERRGDLNLDTIWED